MKMHEFGSGAKSTVVKPRYDLIPIEAIQALANRFSYGASRHGENNWRRGAGDREYLRDRGNHAVEHIFNYLNNRTTCNPKTGELTMPRQHLEAAITNLAMLCALDQAKATADGYDREPEDDLDPEVADAKKAHGSATKFSKSSQDTDPLDIRKP